MTSYENGATRSTARANKATTRISSHALPVLFTGQMIPPSSV